ncbi:MAG TPA: GNAT family N-acetyltransferase [Solirubrobacterales bacterium]|jgi:CelD/BcsL family acetyltransferase involved in cellulose biosynthesis|nr:GNAT family N-acetyltransferase [Solirubrobacterales bacterium]
MDPDFTAWEALAAEAGALPTQDAAWTVASLACFGGKANPLTAGDPAAPEAIAPLVRRGAMLELAGGRDLGEPADLLYRSPEALGRLVEQIGASGRPLALERIPADSPTIAALREALGNRGRVRLSEAAGHPAIELDERWAEPGGGLSSSRRSSLRRARRKAEELGAIEVELLAPAPAEVEALLDEAFAVESRSWKGEAGTAVAFVPSQNDFFRRYAAELADRGSLRIDLLRIDGRAVAMQYGMRWNNRHWLFKIGFDEAFKAGSPGQILLSESVAAAARDGLASYELLGSRDAWTDVWTKDVNPCVGVLAVPRSLRGALGMASVRQRAAEERARGLLKRAKRAGRQAATGRYVAGPGLGDALREEAVYAAAGYATTVGFWNGATDTPAKVQEEALACAESLPAGSEVAIKIVGSGDGGHLDDLLATCVRRGLTLHLDALGPDSATLAQETAQRLHAIAPGSVGCTLPGRWPRSVADAAALAGSGLRVRIVKGEVEDLGVEESDLADGFLAVAAALAGGSCHVEVATQDAALARGALEQLLAAETSCELQVLHAMRSAAAAKVARELGVPVRVYVPYGSSRLPYTREDIQADPKLLAVLARDVLPLSPRRPPGA